MVGHLLCSYFDKMNDCAESEGAGGPGSIMYEADAPKGPIARDLAPGRTEAIREPVGCPPAMRCSSSPARQGSQAPCATRLAEELSLGPLRFRRITGFPMFELHEETGQVASAACWKRSATADLRMLRRAADRLIVICWRMSEASAR